MSSAWLRPALRRRDIDLDAGTIAAARSVGVVRVKGEGAQIVEGVPKTERFQWIIDVTPERSRCCGLEAAAALLALPLAIE